jgi:beta-xylosidase
MIYIVFILRGKNNMKKTTRLLATLCLPLGFISFGNTKANAAAANPTFKEVSVHDPSIMKANGTYYIIGSHMGAAKSNDLMNWNSISGSVSNTKLFNDVKKDLAEALSWGQSDTFWAGDWIKLADGRYYMYYCVCRGDSPQSTIGYAVADKPEGPYKNLGMLLKSSHMMQMLILMQLIQMYFLMPKGSYGWCMDLTLEEYIC